jgi:antitoxin component YwqK of YwqJK toxin-antitoxin module
MKIKLPVFILSVLITSVAYSQDTIHIADLVEIYNPDGSSAMYSNKDKSMPYSGFSVYKQFGSPVVAYTLISEGNTVYKEVYENNVLIEKIYFKGSSRNGPYYKYDKNGNVEIKGYYNMNMQYGSWYYYMDNTLTKTEHYTAGILVKTE